MSVDELYRFENKVRKVCGSLQSPSVILDICVPAWGVLGLLGAGHLEPRLVSIGRWFCGTGSDALPGELVPDILFLLCNV